MPHYNVTVERQGNRCTSIEVPVTAGDSILAAEQAERLAAESFGGRLDQWFAWKVEPDLEGS